MYHLGSSQNTDEHLYDFDTLLYAKKLKQVGFTEAQAEAIPTSMSILIVIVIGLFTSLLG
jgi:hypothetical protein